MRLVVRGSTFEDRLASLEAELGVYVPPHKRGEPVEPTVFPDGPEYNPKNWDYDAKKPRRYPIASKTLQQMIREYNDYNYETYHLKTHFIFGERDRPFLSLMESAVMRIQDITKLLKTKPVFIDTSGGVGGDLIAALIWGRMLRCDSIEKNPETAKMLQHNVEDAKRAVEELPEGALSAELKKEIIDTKVVIHEMTTREYFEKYQLRVSDIVYIDPNWTLEGQNREATPDEMQGYLQKEVLGPLKEQQLYPMFIIVKTRHTSMQSLVYMKEYPGFIHFRSYEGYAFKTFQKGGGFYVHVFFNIQHPDVLTWYHSQYFDNIYDHNQLKVKLPYRKIVLPRYIDDDDTEVLNGKRVHTNPRYKEEYRPRDVSPTPSYRSEV